MDNQNIHYCFTLSERQMELLRSKKYKIDRMECFMTLVSLAVREKTLVPVSKTQQVEILPGQCLIDNTELARLWDKDRKTVPKLLGAMEAVGISSSQKVGDNRIHTIHSLTGWYVDGEFVASTFPSKRSPDSSEIVHAEVPAARLLAVEVEDPKKSDKDNVESGCGKSHSDDTGKPSRSEGSSSLTSSISNDGSNNGNVVTSVATSASSSDGNFRQSDNSDLTSAATPSATLEADGKQNEDERTPSQQHQSGGHGYQPNGSGDNVNKPYGYHNGNGFNKGEI